MFFKIHGVHIDGHKSISLKNGVTSYLDPEFVYFPVNTGMQTYSKLVEIGDQVLMGQPILMRDGRFAHPVCSSVSGKVTQVKKMWHISGKMVEMLEIENDHQDTPYYKQVANPESLTREQIIELVKAAGIVGLGGAGFPTYVKYLPDTKANLIIINAVECEPYLTSDFVTAVDQADKAIEGIKFIMKANNCDKAVICIKKNKYDAIEAIKKALADEDNIKLFLLKDVYPAGWERYIVEQVTHKVYDALPRELGVVVNNFKTALAVYEACTLGKPLIDTLVTVSGDAVKVPQNFRVKIGTKLSNLAPIYQYVDDLGDTILAGGGPMTAGAILSDDLVLSASVGGVTIMHRNNDVFRNNCVGCGKCADNCPSHLTPPLIKAAFVDKDLKELTDLNVVKCVRCGMCSYVCPSRVDITDFMVKAQTYYFAQKRK